MALRTPGSRSACKIVSTATLEMSRVTHESGSLAALLVLDVALFKTGPTSELDGCGGSKDGKGESDGSKAEAHVEMFENVVVRRAISLKNIRRHGPTFILTEFLYICPPSRLRHSNNVFKLHNWFSVLIANFIHSPGQLLYPETGFPELLSLLPKPSHNSAARVPRRQGRQTLLHSRTLSTPKSHS